MSSNILKKYTYKFRNLRVDRAHGAAPNKPILLLALIELIEQGQIRENKILPSPSLFEIFMKYWSILTDRRPNLALPFFHLKSEGFWHHHPNTGYETALRVTTQIKTVSRLREIVAYASFDDELFLLLTNTHDREVVRQTIINTYFTDFKADIESLIAEEQQIDEYRQALLQQVKQTFSSPQPLALTETDNPIRTAGFRQAIMRIYDYTCAVCQLYVLTLDGESVTDAAHIIPFKISGNNDVRNGISLCQLHHWGFDRGLISFTNTYKIIVSDLMVEKGPSEWKFTTLKDKKILVPENKEHYPAQAALAWHREHVFKR
ncbi:MAG: HNH endonuclease [Candidatus Poribacteria bacterium]|nr:HNH endonuclease [Candidatus Poribacteria bacterium]